MFIHKTINNLIQSTEIQKKQSNQPETMSEIKSYYIYKNKVKTLHAIRNT